MTGRAAGPVVGPAAPGRMNGHASRLSCELRLAALGYIGSIATRESARHAGLPDPKDHIGTHVHENDSVQRRRSVSDRQWPRRQPAPSPK